MDQIPLLVESMCSIRDHDFRCIEEKQVESYKNLPQMLLGPRGTDCGGRSAHDRGWFPRPGAIAIGSGGPIDCVLQDSRDGVIVLGSYYENCIGAANALLEFH